MKIREGELHSMAAAIVDGLRKQGFVHFKGDPAPAQTCIVQLIARNLQEEQVLEDEAERLAERHARKMAGMDHRKIIQGIKERLAQERDFPL